MGRLKNMLQKAAIRLLDIKPANPKTITIYERDTYETETLRNRLWYRGDPNELEQYFKRVAKEWKGSAKTKFWLLNRQRVVPYVRCILACLK